MRRDVETTFLRWAFLRALFHRGYVLVSGLYFVVAAHLSAFQLVALGATVAVTLLLSDVPTGVWSDTISRKWPLVTGHLFLGAGMLMTGVVTAFPLILITQVFWGLGWGFSSGADVAWVTDEFDQIDRIDRVLAARARWELVGGATGMVGFGLLGWATGLAAAIVVAGMAMGLLGLGVAIWFREQNFIPTHEPRWTASLSIFHRGLKLARNDDEILLMLAATMIINGACMTAWLFPKQLINLGFPGNTVLWYTALGILSAAFGALSLHIVEAHIDGAGVARRVYALTCFVGVLGLVVLGYAPSALVGSVGVLLVSGITFNITRTVSVIWVNRRTTSDVRTTVHSFLGQAESSGEIVGGVALALFAHVAGIPATLMFSAALIALTGVIVARSGADHDPAAATQAGPTG